MLPPVFITATRVSRYVLSTQKEKHNNENRVNRCRGRKIVNFPAVVGRAVWQELQLVHVSHSL